MDCPHGGECIDPGAPSDCEVNRRCVSFKSAEEKAAFDALPDKYEVVLPGFAPKLFKNKNQVKFYLTDFCTDKEQVALYYFLGDRRVQFLPDLIDFLD